MTSPALHKMADAAAIAMDKWKQFNAGDIYQVKYSVPDNRFTELLGVIFSFLLGLPGASHVIGLLEFLWYWGVFRVLEYVYFRGPSLWGWGFWDGRHSYDICNELVDYKLRFSDHQGVVMCNDMLVKKLETFITMFGIAVYIIAMYLLIRHKCCKSSYKSSNVCYENIKKSRYTRTRIVNTPTPTPSSIPATQRFLAKSQ